MAHYLERYQQGAHEQVWKELVDLGPDIQHPPYWMKPALLPTT